MRIQQSGYSISQILGMLERRELTVNTEYQRGSGFWPKTAMTYLIDTILNDFPIPKLFFFEVVDLATRRTKIEIIDGQQRVNTIRAFTEDKYRLGPQSEKYKGLYFSGLDPDVQAKFLGYPLQVDVILQATESEVLEMFRRMNSHTTPLNNAEKRHAEFNGKFKWFINKIAEEYSDMFIQFGILTRKQSIRMADAELIADIIILFEEGIVNQSPAKINSLYRKYDKTFDPEEEYGDAITSTFEYILENFSELSGSMIFKSYAFYTLVAALMHNKHLINTLETDEVGESAGRFTTDASAAIDGLKQLSYAHEQQDAEGEFKEYVLACLETTHRVKQRTARTKWMLKALNGQI